MSDPVQQADTVAREEEIKTALRNVYDPELGLNVIELGLIRKIDFYPDLTEVTMLLTTPFCPYGPALIEQVRRTVEKTSEKPARVTLAMEMWDPSMMEGGGPPAEWGMF
jgi:metal-sulfur cluster biosynthetic enzyme